MPNDPKLELHTMNSRLMGSIDSASLPSEPPDIRNWFSSYVYESNTLDDFQDLDVSAGIFTEEGKKSKLDDIRVNDKINDGLPAGNMESLDEIVKCNESDQLERSKHAEVVSGLSNSDSLSLSPVSEPPDIRNWFSSYLYETPPPDTADGFMFSDYKESKARNAELTNDSRISEIVTKCNDIVKGSKQTYLADSTDGQKLERNGLPHVPNELASERISHLMLPEQKARACSHHSVEEYINKNTDSKENYAKSDTTLICRGTQNHTGVNVEKYTSAQEGKYLPSIRTKDNSKENPSKKGNFGKENSQTARPENGFVCTRKSGKRTDIESFTKPPQRLQFQPLREGVKHGPDHVENSDTRRNVLSETTNFHLTNALEIKGKWRCPQRTKPNLGPPLKQVRLEQWVRRV